MKKEFKTNDLILATLLMYVSNIKKTINGYFYFEDNDSIKDIVQEYKDRKTMVEPVAFMEKYCYLKKLVYSNIK